MFESISAALISGQAPETASLVSAALAQGVDAGDILEHGLIAGMSEVGVRFRNNDIFVPEVLVAARAMKAGLALLDPIFAASGVAPAGTVVIGTVKGDIHDIGKNLVAVMLRGAGFNVIDIGINASTDQFCDAVTRHQPDVVALSALLTTTMPQMKTTIDALRARGLQTRVMVGGAPVTQHFANSIGADGYGRTAVDAVDVARSLLQVRA